MLGKKSKEAKKLTRVEHGKPSDSLKPFLGKSKEVNKQGGRFCLDVDALVEEKACTIELKVQVHFTQR